MTASAVMGLETDASSNEELVRRGVFFSKSAKPKAFL
jgi:hypothetical protein